MQNNILHSQLTFGDEFSDEAADLISKLLQRDPKKRLGYGVNGTNDIKNHPWFKSIDWDKLYRKEIEPPFKCHIYSELDVNYVDEEILNESVSIQKMSKGKVSIEDDAFAGFSYDGESEMAKYFLSKINKNKSSSPSSPIDGHTFNNNKSPNHIHHDIRKLNIGIHTNQSSKYQQSSSCESNNNDLIFSLE